MPLDVELRESGDLGFPLMARDPDGPSASALRDIALSPRGRTRKSLVGVSLPFSPA